MSYTINEPDECLDLGEDHPDGTWGCSGPIEPTVSLSGETRAYRCERHAEAYRQRMDALDADVQSRYPGWNIPGSMPPPGFDPSYAGERWDEEA